MAGQDQQSALTNFSLAGSYLNYKIVRIKNVPEDCVELLAQLVEGYNDDLDPEDENSIQGPIVQNFFLCHQSLMVIVPQGSFRLQLFCCDQQLMQCVAVKLEKFQLITTHCISRWSNKNCCSLSKPLIEIFWWFVDI